MQLYYTHRIQFGHYLFMGISNPSELFILKEGSPICDQGKAWPNCREKSGVFTIVDFAPVNPVPLRVNVSNGKYCWLALLARAQNVFCLAIIRGSWLENILKQSQLRGGKLLIQILPGFSYFSCGPKLSLTLSPPNHNVLQGFKLKGSRLALL